MLNNLSFAYYRKNGFLQIKGPQVQPEHFFDLCDLVRGELRTIDWREQWMNHD